MRRPALATAIGLAVAVPSATLAVLLRRGVDRIVAPAPPTAHPPVHALDGLGGEVVRLRSRDGLRLAARWLAAGPDDGNADWRPDPAEAILLLHGHGGAIAWDLVERGPFLRRTAAVLGLDLRGHGDSEAAPCGLGMFEVEDVAGALAWLGERGVRRVAIVGTSLGALVALAAVAILGDGSLVAADADPAAPAEPAAAPAPRIVGLVADSATPALALPIAASIHGPLAGPCRRPLAGLVLWAVTRRLGGDPRSTEPGRIVGLVAPLPVLFVHGGQDDLMPVEATRRLAAAAGPAAELWVVPEAGHGAAHRARPAEYEDRVAGFLRRAFAAARGGAPIIPPEVPRAAPAS